MKKIDYIFKGIIATIILGTSGLSAQNNSGIPFKSGEVKTEANLDELISLTNSYTQSELVNGNYYRIIQFNNLPTNQQKEELGANGFKLLNFISSNAYYVQVKSSAQIGVLKKYDVRALMNINPSYKLSQKLAIKQYDDWALNGSKIKVNAIYFDGLSKELVSKELNKLGAKLIFMSTNNVARVEIDLAKLNNLYAQPYIYYFEQIDAPSEPENLVGASDHRSNSIATAYSSGLHYDGTGVTVMMQDNSMLDQHIDYTGRFTDMNASQTGDHGEHVGGTIAGAGNLNPIARGMAYGADVLVYDPDNNNYSNFVANLYTNNGMRITSKSYSNGVNAGYTSLAQLLDQQIRTMPELIHVFSAGNSNGSGSTAAGSQWFNITGGHKAGKNVITCANLTYTDVISGSSSRGPCADGRIKPDISAVGTNVYSTIDPNTYGFKTGTSMSCPGVAGTIAQLYHAYKDLNSNANPPSGLIKALVLNTADDIGNSGPDFIHGWGRINARRAFDVMSNNQYITGSISNSGSNTHNITVPAGTAQLKVMVLWVDYEGAVSSSPSLVNNINMTVTPPSSSPVSPWVLNPAPNATTLNQPAVRGTDNLNNMEQVTIDAPGAGTYTVNVTGASIPQGPQTYYVVYEFITNDVVLTYPIGGEGIDSDVDETIRWDAFGNSGTFTLEYSTNNGASWNTIATGISSTQRYYDWNVPAVVTGRALVRVSRGLSTSQSHQVFSIITVPTGLTVNWACPTTMEVTWNAVAGATGYEVSLLGNKYMDSVGTVTGTNVLVINAPSNVDHWWSVKALGPNNCVGRRAIARYQSAGTFNCVVAVDAELSGLDPLNNAQVLSCMAPTLDVTVNIQNNGQSAISNVPVHYTFNGGPAVNETYAGPLAVGANINYTFTAQVSPVVGANNLVVWNDLAGDGNNLNDTVISQFTYVNSVPKTIPWTENFETFTLCGTNSDCELEVCNMINDFTNEANGSADDIDWRTDENGTPSNGTGPSVDFNPGTAIGNYLYLEASGAPVCSNKQANLISPCIDLINVSSPSLTYAYNMNGATMGSLHVDILINGTWTNDITPAINGDQGTNWIQNSIPLNAYIGNIVNFRFRGITGSNWESDMAIDDISVSGTVNLDENSLATSFSIYPNPSNGLYNFNYNGNDIVTAKIIDINGRVVFEKILSPMEKGLIDLGNYANGLYMLVLNTDELITTKKIIKE